MTDLRKTLKTSLAEARARLETALREEGFGILTEIDVAATLKARLGLERPPSKPSRPSPISASSSPAMRCSRRGQRAWRSSCRIPGRCSGSFLQKPRRRSNP